MKIGIEGRLLSRNITGLERYIYNLSIHLPKFLPLQDKIFLYIEKENRLKINVPENISTRDVKKLYSDIKNQEIDLYHRTFHPQTLDELASFIESRFIFTPHDLIAYRKIYNRNIKDFENYRKIFDITINAADIIIAISEYNKKEILHNFDISENRIEVIYQGIENKFKVIENTDLIKKFKNKYSLPENYILYIGTDYPHKNLKNLFLAFNQYIKKRKMKDIYLIIAGESYYGKKYLEKEIKELDDNLLIFGHFPEEDLVYLYNGALAFIYPSLYEGFGIPPLEAMACGIPVLASNKTSLPEIIGTAGILTNVEDIDEFSDSIDKIISDQELRKKLVKSGLERVKKFNWEITAKKTLEVYNRAIKINDTRINSIKKGFSWLYHEEIKNLKNEISNLKDTINNIYKTRIWKLTSEYIKLRNKLIIKPMDLAKKTLNIYKTYGTIHTIKRIISYISKGKINFSNREYKTWIKLNEPKSKDLNNLKRDIEKFKYNPVISIIMPVYNTKKKWLNKAILSVVNQIYNKWELCIVDDGSKKIKTKKTLLKWAKKDGRIKIKYFNENKGIVAASNTAISFAMGDYIGFLDHDDEIAPFALYEIVKLLNKHPEADVVYSDEDKINTFGKRFSPYFKPDWSPDLLLSHMYTCHFSIYRKSLVEKIGRLRIGFDGAQDYDLVLRFTELTQKIFHVPKILYHWRVHRHSTAGNANSKIYAHEASYKAIKEALMRRNEKAIVEKIKEMPGNYIVHFIPRNNNFITIIIPTKDKHELLNMCLSSIFNKTNYNNYEILIIDNNSAEKETFKTFEKWKSYKPDYIRIERLELPFNFSKLNNHAAKIAKGNILLFLNNDTEVISDNWIEEMVGQAERKTTGCVGAILYYPDNKIQHAGVVLGIGGVAGHAFRHFSANSIGYYGRAVLISNYSAVTGACMMVKRSIFEEIGGFDENLPVAYNDVDFCIRVRNKGYFNLVLPQVKLYHHESKTRGYDDRPENIKRFQRDKDYIQKKWGNVLYNDPFYNPNLTLEKEDFSLRL